MHTNFWEFLDEKAKVYKSKSRLGWQILRLSFMVRLSYNPNMKQMFESEY